jgi:hypothetical protein
MFAQFVYLSAMLMGFDVGWQPRPEGGMEYIIQFNKEDIESLKEGRIKFSDIPLKAGDVKSFSIVVGEKELARTNPPAPLDPPTLADAAAPHKASAAGYNEPGETRLKPEAAPAAAPSPTRDKTEEPAKPWMLQMFLSLGLFLSLGGNLYLIWLLVDLFRRYRRLLVRH